MKVSVNVENFTGRRHRTALFVDAQKAKTDSAYRERTRRLIESLNKPGNSPSGTIKVDVYEVDGNTVRPYNTTPQYSQSPANQSELQAWAERQGYTQVLTSSPGRKSGW